MATDTIATQLVEELMRRGLKITTAESCTGGLIAAAITDISGSSNVFEQGVVTYANRAKTALLGVDEKTLEQYGAVSKEVACAMAEGARENAGADIALSVTGIAGPTGGTPSKPLGLVFIAVSTAKATKVMRHCFSGSRKAIREQSMRAALKLALSSLGNIRK